MHAFPAIEGLSQISDAYDVILSDIWGVLHNGVAAWQSAVDALHQARLAGKHVLLISNSPRPGPLVEEQLASLGVPHDAYDGVITSGDLTRDHLSTRYRGAKVTHIGPPKDHPLVNGLPVTFVDDESAELCLCSGLLDDLTETPDDYRARLEALAERGLPMMCANPDKVVEMGDRLIYCAGALADLYEQLGGETILFGKPHPPIYEAALAKAGNPTRAKVLGLGDSLRTDLRGAADQGFDCLFLTGGIHAMDVGSGARPDADRVNQLLKQSALPARGWMHRLAW